MRPRSPRGPLFPVAPRAQVVDFLKLVRAEQLLESVKRESPKARAAKPRFVGIANPSSYCFANATIQCLRHTPRLAEELCAAAPPTPRGLLGRRHGPETLLQAFVTLLRRMDTGRGVHEKDDARLDFIQQCSEQPWTIADANPTPPPIQARFLPP